MKKITFLLVLMLCASLSCFANFTLTVTGFVKTASGTPVVGANLVVSIFQNTATAQLLPATTNSVGKYTVTASISDSISQGVATIQLLCSNGTATTQSKYWSPTAHTLEQNFTACSSPTACTFVLSVASTVSPNGGVYLTANTNPTDPAGASSYTYKWSSGQLTKSIFIANPGNYCVTATSIADTSCHKTVCYSYTLPLDSLCQAYINVTPIDATHRKLTANTVHNTAGTTYLWSNNATTKDITVTASGTYCVTITTPSGCHSYACQAVSFIPCNFQVSISSAQSWGDTTYLNAEVVFGQGTIQYNYTYHWSNGSNSSQIKPLVAGQYCVTVTTLPDSCQKTACFTYTQDSCHAFIEVFAIDSLHKKLTAIGYGPAPYTYTWSNGATTKDITVGTSGQYCVKVINAAGCSANYCVQVQINPPPVCNFQVVVTASSSSPTAPKVLVATVSNAGNYSYNWSNGQHTSTITVTAAGQYCVTVTLQNTQDSCKKIACYTVVFPPDSLCTATISLVNVDAAHKRLIASGTGAAPFIYMWTGPGGFASTLKEPIVEVSGNYCVKITNGSGCMATACKQVQFSTVIDSTCKAKIVVKIISTTVLKLTASSTGTAPFTYLWSTGATGQYIGVSHTGTYCVTVTTATGCKSSTCVDVEFDNPANTCAVSISMQSANINSSKLTANPVGTAPFTYLWSTGATTKDINVYHSRNYCVTITGAGGCTATACRDVFIPGDSTSCFLQITKTKLDSHRVKLSVYISGGGPYTYAWSNGSTASSIIAATAGNYCVSATNGFGCTASSCVIVNPLIGQNDNESFYAGGTQAALQIAENTLTVAPNPTDTELNLRINTLEENNAVISVLNASGVQFLSKNTPLQKGSQALSFDVSTLNAGIYFIQIKLESGQILTQRIVKM